MIKILVLMASNVREGRTRKLLNFYLNRLQKNFKKTFMVRIVNIYSLHIQPCDGCGFCKIKGICLKNRTDDFLKLIYFIKQSNFLIVASAVYFLGFPAKLKAIVDRCNQFYCKKKRLGSFKNLNLLSGSLVLAGGRVNFECLKQILKCCNQFFSCLDVTFKECLVAPRTDIDGLFFLINKFF